MIYRVYSIQGLETIDIINRVIYMMRSNYEYYGK